MRELDLRVFPSPRKTHGLRRGLSMHQTTVSSKSSLTEKKKKPDKGLVSKELYMWSFALVG